MKRGSKMSPQARKNISKAVRKAHARKKNGAAKATAPPIIGDGTLAFAHTLREMIARTVRAEIRAMLAP